MEEQGEAKDNLNVPGVTEWTPTVVMIGSEDWSEDGFSLAEVAETLVEEANIDTGGIDLAEGLAASDLTTGPTGQVSKEVDVANPSGLTGVDVGDRGEFDPNWFWLLLAQAGCEVW